MKKFPIPLSYFSVPLGLSALGLSLRYGAAHGLLPAQPVEYLLGIATLIWLSLIIAYIVKILSYRHEFLSELHDIIQCCFISTIPITTLLVAMIVLPYAPMLAKVLIGLGIVGQLLFAMYRAAGLWRGTHSFDATTPVIYLPTVASAFVTTNVLAALGLLDYAWLFLGMGMLSWLSLESVILLRLRTSQAVNPKVRGIVGIQLAPAFVGCSAYFSVNGGTIDSVSLMLIGYGLLQALFLIRLLPWFFEEGFSMSFWGFSFGLAAMTGCGLHLIIQQHLTELGYIMWYLGIISIGFLVLGTLNLLRQGKLFVK